MHEKKFSGPSNRTWRHDGRRSEGGVTLVPFMFQRQVSRRGLLPKGAGRLTWAAGGSSARQPFISSDRAGRVTVFGFFSVSLKLPARKRRNRCSLLLWAAFREIAFRNARLSKWSRNPVLACERAKFEAVRATSNHQCPLFTCQLLNPPNCYLLLKSRTIGPAPSSCVSICPKLLSFH